MYKFMVTGTRDTWLNSPTYDAYIFLNVIRPLQKAIQTDGNLKNFSKYQSDTDYNEFKTALEKNEIIHPEDIRTVDRDAKIHTRLNRSSSGKIPFYNSVDSIIDKAYRLGMIDKQGKLLQAYQSSI